MACGTACQSNCYKEEEEEEKKGGDDKGIGATTRRNLTDPSATLSPLLCSKCKDPSQSILPSLPSNYNEASLCLSCFRLSLFGKFKLAVTSHAMISPTDNILIAFSGGPASRVVLQFIHEMQSKAKRNFDASRDRSSLPVFGVGVAFIDERAVSSIPSDRVDEAIEEIKLIVSSLAPPLKKLHIRHIESLYSDFGEGRSRLKELLRAVNDVTGKEDLLRHLRMLCLQKIASENGYSKLALGTCTSRIACHVISATVKGQGYSLPADVQHVDARWEIPVVLPLRDCLAEELIMLCKLDSLKTQLLLDDTHSGINGLVSSFVKLLQEENPSRECTIVRTAEKLSPFSFNKLPETNCYDHLSPRRRHNLQNLIPDESTPVEVLCAICASPLSNSYLQSLRGTFGSCQRSDIFAANCCQSCCFQIIPKDPSSTDYFCSLLPESMAKRVNNDTRADPRWLREQIKDCLLLEDENES